MSYLAPIVFDMGGALATLASMNPSSITQVTQALNCFAALIAMGVSRRIAARIALAYTR